MRSQIQVLSNYMKSFNLFLGVSLADLLLKHNDNLSKSLLSSKMSAAEGPK